MKQQQQRQPRLIGTTGLGLLVLSYATALPWLLRGEAVDLAPFLCALVFGCCLIRPLTIALQRAPGPARATALLFLTLIAAAIAFIVTGGHGQRADQGHHRRCTQPHQPGRARHGRQALGRLPYRFLAATRHSWLHHL